MPILLEKNSYTKWLTVLDSPGAYTLEEQMDEVKNRYYEFYFVVDGRAAIFTDLTRVEWRDGEKIGIYKNPDWIPPEVGEEITKHHPKLQPIHNWKEFETPKCVVCQSQLLYSDNRKEYFCPFCKP